jgi:hypothetical protein
MKMPTVKINWQTKYNIMFPELKITPIYVNWFLLVRAVTWCKMHLSATTLLGFFFTATEAWRVFLTDEIAVRIQIMSGKLISVRFFTFPQSIHMVKFMV